MNVLILAGGLGTRLQPLLSDQPKPMAPTGDKPFLEYLIAGLHSQGFLELVLCVGHMAAKIQDHFGNGRRFGVHITYVVERDLLGTAGAIKNAQKFIKNTFIVMNGDSFLDIQIGELVEHHRQGYMVDRLVTGTIAAIKVKDATNYGRLTINTDGRITHFSEKAISGSGWINGGIYVLEPGILDYIPSRKAVSIEMETFPLVLQRGFQLQSFPTQGFFVDIGTPEGYQIFLDHLQERIL